MSDSVLSIRTASETIFFKYIDGLLRQVVHVSVALEAEAARPAIATLTAGGEQVRTTLDVVPGEHEYTVYAPTLWPERRPDSAASLSINTGDAQSEIRLIVGSHRPWTVYVLSDTCTDYTWAYDDEDKMISDDAALLLAEIVMAEESAGLPSADRNRYNLVHAREVAFFLDRYPDQAERLWQHIRRGSVTLNPFYSMAMTSAMSLEELVRQFYPARRWAIDHALEIGYANHQETPTITWSMASILAQCGIGHLVKSILPYECPWASRLQELPVFAWEGPDGARILVRLRKTNYAEARYVSRGLEETNQALHTLTIPRYEALGTCYPFSTIGAVGAYSDLSSRSVEMAKTKCDTIRAYNAQGWDYPLLVNASHRQFWDDLEHQMAARSIELPVVCGDYGTSWEAWPTCMAHDLAGWRRAQERAAAADGLCVVGDALGAPLPEGLRDQLAEGWSNLLSLTDHAWNGSSPGNLALNVQLRRRWQVAANHAFDAVMDQAMVRLSGGNGRATPADCCLVANPRGWARSGVVQINGINGPHKASDATSGEPVRSQWDAEERALLLSVRDVPALGLRSIALEPVREDQMPSDGPWLVTDTSLEGRYYRVTADPATGTIRSLYDKQRQREMVDEASPYGLNEALYWSDGVEHRSRGKSVSVRQCGPVQAELVIMSQVADIDVVSIVTLYSELDRIDIGNLVHKPLSVEKQELDFCFPLNVPERRVLLGAPGAIIDAASEFRPGAGLAYTVARHLVDMRNEDYGVLFTLRDGLLVEFGHRTTLEDPLSIGNENGTILAVALENVIDWNESVHDQVGITDFRFRYSLRGHGSDYALAQAATDAWDTQDELLATLAANDGAPTQTQGLVSVSGEAVLTYAKRGEESGAILRLWVPGHEDTDAVIDLSAWRHSAVTVTDPLERRICPLEGENGRYHIRLPGRGFATLKVE